MPRFLPVVVDCGLRWANNLTRNTTTREFLLRSQETFREPSMGRSPGVAGPSRLGACGAERSPAPARYGTGAEISVIFRLNFV